MTQVIAFAPDGRRLLATYVGEAVDPFTGRKSLLYRTAEGRMAACVGHMELPANVAVMPAKSRIIQFDQPKGAA